MSPDRIVSAVANHFSVRIDALCGQRRTKTIALPSPGGDVLASSAHRHVAGGIGRCSEVAITPPCCTPATRSGGLWAVMSPSRTR